MKAYRITDKEGYNDYLLVVFAENRSKAISSALGTDEFPSSDWEFTELRATRVPSLDFAYRGYYRMDWYNDTDRLALVKDGGFYCNEDTFYPEECKVCAGKEYCKRYKEYLAEEGKVEQEWMNSLASMKL